MHGVAFQELLDKEDTVHLRRASDWFERRCSSLKRGYGQQTFDCGHYSDGAPSLVHYSSFLGTRDKPNIYRNGALQIHGGPKLNGLENM